MIFIVWMCLLLMAFLYSRLTSHYTFLELNRGFIMLWRGYCNCDFQLTVYSAHVILNDRLFFSMVIIKKPYGLFVQVSITDASEVQPNWYCCPIPVKFLTTQRNPGAVFRLNLSDVNINKLFKGMDHPGFVSKFLRGFLPVFKEWLEQDSISRHFYSPCVLNQCYHRADVLYISWIRAI